MRLILRQSFPLGRFHATLWRANPFDKELAGEWPPSPWRLVRAVVARWYQWRRETAGTWPEDELERLVGALCSSDFSFYLPEHARQSVSLRQYQPAEFGMDPPNFKLFEASFSLPNGGFGDKRVRKTAEIAKKVDRNGSRLVVHVKNKKDQKSVEKEVGKPTSDWRGLNPDPGARGYATNLTQDNAWCIPPDASLFWFIEGKGWTSELVEILDRCLERIVYFGRAETLTSLSHTINAPALPNVMLAESRTSGDLVPVLVPMPEARRADIERVTHDPLAGRSIPQGARLLYARRPPSPPAREIPRRTPRRSDTHLVQFALGWAVAPERRATVYLTARFRSAMLRNLIRLKTNGAASKWSDAPTEIRDAMAGITGKDSRGEPLRGPRTHAEFLLWWDGDAPTRLLVWRGAQPFDDTEQEAILRAAAQELSWANAWPDADAWKIKLIPLDTAVAPPPGFDGVSARVWRSLTPYVPPRHHLRNGKVRKSETIENQIRREFLARGYAPNTNLLSIEEIESSRWVAVHTPRRKSEGRLFIGDRRGSLLRLTFDFPVTGPLRLGHSSNFGLGLFVPSP